MVAWKNDSLKSSISRSTSTSGMARRSVSARRPTSAAGSHVRRMSSSVISTVAGKTLSG
uniref:Uncharacterized protein n=1 Tax=Myoviridae sp. ctbwh6 TaxID=2827611 RepID=A0A8S5LHL6_9CAUD|nr:MAG TPA: hypothetical protein [Myoviridae sp. ctbwh6]